MPKQQRLSAPARRATLLQAAREVFLEVGYNAAATRAIAARAGVNETILYRHFNSKEELFREAIADPLEQAVGHTTELSLQPDPDADTDDVRARSVVFIRDLLTAMQDIAPMLGLLLASDPDRGEHFYRERFAPSIDAVRDVVISNLPFWNHREFDADIVVRVVYGACWFIALDARYGEHEPRPPESLAPEILGLLFEGLLPRDPKTL